MPSSYPTDAPWQLSVTAGGELHELDGPVRRSPYPHQLGQSGHDQKCPHHRNWTLASNYGLDAKAVDSFPGGAAFMRIGIGIPNQVRNVNPTIVAPWATRAERAGFSTLGTIGRIAYPGVQDTVALAAAAGATST